MAACTIVSVVYPEVVIINHAFCFARPNILMYIQFPRVSCIQSIQRPHIHGILPAPTAITPLPLLPPIHPTRTIYTPLRLLTLPLPAILALDLPLYNIVPTAATIQTRDSPQNTRYQHKPHNLIEEVAIREDDGAVRQRLVFGVVAVGDAGVVVRAVLEGGKFLVEVACEER
jgi:hypothetical protein